MARRSLALSMSAMTGTVLLSAVASVASTAVQQDRASAGLCIGADGKDYKTLRIKEVLKHSPASEAGLQANDVISTIDRRAVSNSTLS